MKIQAVILVLTIASILPACTKSQAISDTPPPPRVYVVAIPPNLPEEDRDPVWQSAGLLVLDQANIGDEIHFFDPVNLHEITDVVIPKEAVMQHNATARGRRLKDKLEALQSYLKTPPPAQGMRPGSFLEPQALELIAGQWRVPGQPLTVILIGSSFYVHPRDLEWNFDPDRYPSDAHLGADPALTPFSTRDRADALEGIAVYHAYLHPEFPSEAYRVKVTRWWNLWIGSQKGVCGAFGVDLPLVIKSAIRGEPKPVQVAAVDSADDKLLMHEPPKPPTDMLASDNWIVAKQVDPATPAPFNPVVNDLKVGIRWPGMIDLDLYSSSAPDKAVLSYRLSRTPEGEHQKDYLDAPLGINGFETVTFNGPVDLRSAMAAVNFYSGNAPAGAEFEVRISCDGHSYSQVGKIAATSGNHGGVAGERSSDPHWVVLNLAKIVGLTPAPVRAAQNVNP